MPVLRDALEEAGFEDVKTYVQSGNVVLTTNQTPRGVARTVASVIEERFDLDIGVVVRTRAEVARVVRHDPLADVVTEAKRYQVTFLDGDPASDAIEKLQAAASGDEVLVHRGRELYTWHPDGMGRSKLARLLSDRSLGVTATSRNWSTVTQVLALAETG